MIVIVFFTFRVEILEHVLYKSEIKKMRKVLKPNIDCQTKLSGLQFKVICALAGPEVFDY